MEESTVQRVKYTPIGWFSIQSAPEPGKQMTHLILKLDLKTYFVDIHSELITEKTNQTLTVLQITN